MKIKIIIFFLLFFSFINPTINVIINFSQEYKNFSINSYFISLNSLTVQGETTLGGLAVFLNGIIINNLSASNTNCNFNTNFINSGTNQILTFGIPNQINSITINGMPVKNDLKNYLIIDEKGNLFQQTLEKKYLLNNDPIQKINKLYVTNISNYTANQLSILTNNSDQLTINTTNDNNIQLIGNNINLNFNTIDSSNGPIYFSDPVILNGQYTIKSENTNIKNNFNTNTLTGNINDITFFQDGTINSNVTINGISFLDGNIINITANQPIIFNSNNIIFNGITVSQDITNNFLTLNAQNELNQTQITITNIKKFNHINSPKNTNLTISSTNNISISSFNQSEINVNGSTIFLDGNLDSFNEDGIIFDDIVFFIDNSNIHDEESYITELKSLL